MGMSLEKFVSCRRIVALWSVLVFGLARQGSAQTTPVGSYASLVTALNAGFTTITNFQTNSPTSPLLISLTSGQSIQITNNVTIDAGTNFILFQGNGVARLFYVYPNASLTLNKLELTGGVSTNGGAIYNEGTLIISNCLLTGNLATNSSGTNGGSGPVGVDSNGANGGSGGMAAGGAIYSTGPVIISYSILSNNFAEAGNGGNGGNAGGIAGNGGSAGYGGNAYGGALYSTGSNNIIYMTEFATNECIAGYGGSGGSFATSGSGGAAGLGGSCAGGAAFVAGSLYMTNCLFFDNYAMAGGTGKAEVDSDGGGADGSPGGSALGGCLFITNGVADADIENTIFYHNACYGGYGGSTALNAAIGGAGGQAQGGGVWSGAALTQMSFCTLVTNSLTGGAGGTNTAAGINGAAGAASGYLIYGSAGVFDLSASILSYDYTGTNYPNAVGVTDAGYNVSSDATPAKSTIVPTTRLNTNPDLNFELVPLGPKIGGPFGSQQMFTLAILTNSPAGSFVPGVPGSTFPATDEALQDRSTPTSAGAYEVNPASIQTNAQLPMIISTLPGTNFTGAGDSVTFTTAVTTQNENPLNPLPFGYQWQLDGTNISDNANYSGTTSNILTVKKVTIADQGEYMVLVSPTLLEGYTNSPVVELILTNPPVITTQPVSQLNRPVGSIVTFTLGVESPLNFNYQWLYGNSSGTISLTNGGNIFITNNVLTINPASTNDAGSYSVIVSNNYGAKTSAVVRLTIVPDKTRPTVTITSPVANSRTNNPNTPAIRGTATDNAQVIYVKYWLTNFNAGLSQVTNVQFGHATLTTNGSTNLNAPTTTMLWSITNPPWPGTNILAVQSVDYSSNVSTVLTRRFFYQVPSSLILMSNTVGGAGTLTGHAFIKGDAAPSNGASLNIGEGYSIVAAPNSASLLGSWTITNSLGTNVVITNGNTLKFTMESNTSIQALFVTNMFLGAGVHGTYNGLFYVTNEVAFDSAGMLDNLVLSKQGSFSGKLLLAGGNYSLSGAFDAFGHVTNHVVARSKELGPLIIDMDLDTNGVGIITGAVTNATWPTNANLWAGLAAATTGTTNYTLLMAPSTNAPTNIVIPTGYGYALISDHEGTVTLSGGLADGTTFSQTVPASQSKNVPVYVSMYAKTGFLFGWLNLTNLGGTNAADELMWIKGVPAHPTLLFPDGFTNLLPTAGSIWTNLSAITLPTNNTLAISNAGLDLNYTLAVSDEDKLVTAPGATNSSTNSLTGTINLKTGLLQITFGNGDGKATTKGYGAMLQDTTNAGGYFVIGTNAGSIILSSSTNYPPIIIDATPP
jgi:hypothetical protein